MIEDIRCCGTIPAHNDRPTLPGVGWAQGTGFASRRVASYNALKAVAKLLGDRNIEFHIETNCCPQGIREIAGGPYLPPKANTSAGESIGERLDALHNHFGPATQRSRQIFFREGT